jgi:diguanylate cyclase (GGDEF)-like protein/PAS domain S-box-containing protein
MASHRRPSSRVFTVSGAVLVPGLCLAAFGWRLGPIAAFTGLLAAAALTSTPALQPASRHWPVLRLSFVVEFLSLVTFGAVPTIGVAACGLLARQLLNRQPSANRWQFPRRIVTLLVAWQGAAYAFALFDAATGELSWPRAAAPVAAAALAYCLVMVAVTNIAVPMIVNRSVRVAWRASSVDMLRGCATHLVAASVAAGLVEMVVQRRWDVLVMTAIPLVLAYWLFADHESRLEEERHRSDAMSAAADGVCILDRTGRVILWSDALERLLACPRERAAGYVLTAAVPGLANTELPRALDEVARSRTSRTVAHLQLQCGGSVRILQVRIVAVADRLTLFWDDVTDERHAMQALRRQSERLELAVQAANDGFWEWDLHAQQFYVTGPWNAMIGRANEPCVSGPELWLERVHPEDIGHLNGALEAHLSGNVQRFEHEHRVRHEDGTYRFVRCRGVAVRSGNGRAMRIAGAFTDITDLSSAHAQLRNAFYLDPLTGLCNRTLFVEQLGRRLKASHERPGGEAFALLYLDLDRFKIINDSLGHLVGDELLVAVSRRLESCLRPGDVLSRLGGDEFAILLNALHTDQQANVIAFRVQETLSKPFSIDGREVFTSASIGIAYGAPRYTTPDEMMHDADTAMYQAKAHGKARHEVFDADMDARTKDRLGLENDLRRAVAGGEIEVHYQPIVALPTGMCVGFESLVRWSRNGKPVSPAIFIPIAEELGLIEGLGTQVMEEVCRTFAAWQRAMPGAGLECITVNVSSRQLMQQNFLSIVDRAVCLAGLDRSALRIEITETALMTDPNEAVRVLKQLRDFGVKIYLDDFGTGYSSLSHLHNLPVDALKIDRSFVESLFLPHRPAIVESIMALARTLHTSVVAEGIETAAQARELERLGCTRAQGYLFSRAVPPAAAEAIVRSGLPLGAKRGEAAAGAVPAPLEYAAAQGIKSA